MRLLATAFAALLIAVAALATGAQAGHAFSASVEPLSPTLKKQLVARGHWRAGCPVPLSGLRVLTVDAWDFDGTQYSGQLIVNARVTAQLTTVFKRLYALRFPVRNLTLEANYGTKSERSVPDVSGSFECRQAVPSPCSGNKASGHWSMHAYGEAVDVNPDENPYVGCGMTRNKKALSYMNRGNVRPGMVTPAVVAAFSGAGWGWGGSWTGSTKDYMHFSTTGH